MVKKLLILNDLTRKSLSNKELKLVRLKHPKSNDLVPFLIVESCDDLLLYELISYSPEMASVFIDDFVQSDALLYMASPFNIIYFLMDFVATLRSANSFKSIDEFKRSLLVHMFRDTLADEEFENVHKNLKISQEDLGKLFNIKGTKR